MISLRPVVNPPTAPPTALPSSAGQDVDLAAKIVQLGNAASGGSEYAGRVALVDHDQSVVLLGQSAYLVERSGVAVHREYTVGADYAEALRLSAFEAIFQFGHVGVGIAVAHGLAESYAVDYRGVVQRVGDDCVLLREQRLETRRRWRRSMRRRGSYPRCRSSRLWPSPTALWIS